MPTLHVYARSRKMSWTPVYIEGNEGFKEAVVAKLENTWPRGSADSERDLVMFWLRKTSDLREFKEAIGSKLIFKYRMRFIADLNIHLGHINKRSDNFSDSENDLIKSMREREVRQDRIPLTRK